MYDKSMIPGTQKHKVGHAVKIRSHRKRLLKVRRPRTEKYKNSFAYRGPKKWNSLPEAFHLSQSKAIYKSLVAARMVGKNSLGDTDMEITQLA